MKQKSVTNVIDVVFLHIVGLLIYSWLIQLLCIYSDLEFLDDRFSTGGSLVIFKISPKYSLKIPFAV